jgi:hypothetical protein
MFFLIGKRLGLAPCETGGELVPIKRTKRAAGRWRNVFLMMENRWRSFGPEAGKNGAMFIRWMENGGGSALV